MTNSTQANLLGEIAVDDDSLAVLANERRRTVLRCLRAVDLPMAVADLGREVVARERGTDPSTVPAAALDRVHVALHHAHLPKLADAGFVRFVDDRTAVESADDADSLDPVLDWFAERTE